MADAAQEVVLGGIEFEQLGVLRLHLAEQLGIADGDRDLAGEEVEQVLIGSLPGSSRRQAPHEDAERVTPDAEVRTDRPRLTGDGLLRRDLDGIHEDHRGIEHAERRLGVDRRLPGQEFSSVARRGALDRSQDLAELAVAALEIGGQAVVAVGQSGQFVVAGHADRGGEVSGGHAIHRCRDRA